MIVLFIFLILTLNDKVNASNDMDAGLLLGGILELFAELCILYAVLVKAGLA